jgi:hypothetical protein
MIRMPKVDLASLRVGLWVALISWIGLVAPSGGGVRAAEFQPLEIATAAGV